MALQSSTLTVIRQGFMDYMGYGAPWFRGTTSGAGDVGKTTLLGAAVMARLPNDRVNSWWAYVTSGAALGDIKSIKDYTASSMTVDVTGDIFTAQIAATVTYELSPWHPTYEVLYAINQALHEAYPDLKRHILNYDLVTGNALPNGSFEDITGTAADYWVQASGTVTTYAAIKRYGSRSLSVTTGMARQNVSSWSPLLNLGGETVYFEAWGYVTAASTARLGIQDDGGTIQYSDYHTGNTKWRLLRKQVTISDSPSALVFSLYSDTATAALFDYARVLSPNVNTYVVPSTWKQTHPQNVSFQVSGAPSGNEQLCDDQREIAEFNPLTDVEWSYDTDLGAWLMFTPTKPPVGYKFKLEGDEVIADLSAETDTVPLNTPQLTLLYPLIAKHLFTRLGDGTSGAAADEYYKKAAIKDGIYQRLRASLGQETQAPRVNYGNWNP